MIFCAKYAMCSIRFTKKFKHGNVSFFFLQFKPTFFPFKVIVDANLIQSLTITMARIKEISTKMASLSREIGVMIIPQT